MPWGNMRYALGLNGWGPEATQILTSGTTVEPFTLEDFDHYMDLSEEIRRQVELDWDREAEG